MLELNKVQLVGRLTKDPDCRTVGNANVPLAELRLAADRQWTNKNTGEKEKEVLFVTVKVWNKLAEYAGSWLKKGAGIYVEGRLSLETWKDKQTGQDRERLVILGGTIKFAESKADAERRMSGGAGATDSGYSDGYEAPSGPARQTSAAPTRSHGTGVNRDEAGQARAMQSAKLNEDLPF